MNLKEYMQDGADYRARAVIAYLSSLVDVLEPHYIQIYRVKEIHKDGYILSLNSSDKSQLNIVLSGSNIDDSIYAIKWEQSLKKPLKLKLNRIKFLCKTEYEEAAKMAECICLEFDSFLNNKKGK